jgi:hypothetical protein
MKRVPRISGAIVCSIGTSSSRQTSMKDSCRDCAGGQCPECARHVVLCALLKTARYWKRKDRALFVGSGYGNHHRDFVTPLAGSGRHRFGRGSVTRNDVPCHYASSRVQFAYGTPCPLGCELGEIPPLDTGLNAKIS